MIGNIIVILIFYACLVGLYWLYKREKTDISTCDNWFIELMSTIGKMGPSYYDIDSKDRVGAAQAIMDFDPRFDVGGIYSLENYINVYKKFGDDYNPTTEETEQLLTVVTYNCVSVLKSKTKFKTNWLYFGDGF